MIVSSLWFLLCLLLLCCFFVSLVTTSSTSFSYAALEVAGDVKEPLDFTLTFRTARAILPSEYIGFVLPRFTQRLSDNQSIAQNISMGDLLVAPSSTFRAKWLEGFNAYGYKELPFASSLLLLATQNNATISGNTLISVQIFKENGIGAVCGFAGSDLTNTNTSLVYPSVPFFVATIIPGTVDFEKVVLLINTTYSSSGALLVNSSTLTNYTFTRESVIFQHDARVLDSYSELGNGCSNWNACSGNGQCDYCYEKCRCQEGWGNATDLLAVGASASPDCSTRTCPSGRAFGDLATASNQAHALAECSNQGLCNRSTGQCSCFPPFSGSACEKLDCPKRCSGHGRCLSMTELARVANLEGLNRVPIDYGSSSGMNNVAWDFASIYGCYCDSSWPVGFDVGQRQLSEYFGPDCSLRHCPSGDDPFTTDNETDCTGKSQVGGRTGRSGNLCQVDCSNRGKCNYATGVCSCFSGSWGEACEKISNAGSAYEIEVNQTDILIGGN
eukprot:gene6073-6687_t